MPASPEPARAMHSGRSASASTALVTGGSAGIGRAVCERLLGDGRTVVSLDLRADTIEHPQMATIRVDLTDRAAARAAAADAVRRFQPTTLVHNAGVIRPALLADVKLEDLDALVELHLASALQLVQAALPAMRSARFGRIVLVSSRAALGLATRTAYSATKAGLIGMARTWALELAADGITVNVVAPGPIATDMFYGAVPRGGEQERKIAAGVPVGRLGSAADVARAVSFFADDAAGFVTGQVLYVCGGTSVGGLVL